MKRYESVYNKKLQERTDTRFSVNGLKLAINYFEKMSSRNMEKLYKELHTGKVIIDNIRLQDFYFADNGITAWYLVDMMDTFDRDQDLRDSSLYVTWNGRKFTIDV